MAVVGDRTFLGLEFLTWLWFRCETDEAEFELEESGLVGVFFEDSLALVAESEEGAEAFLRKGAPTRTREAGAALLGGKKVVRARMRVACGPAEWTLAVDGMTLDLRSIQCPPARSDSREEALVERLESLETIRAIVDELYRVFLEARLSHEWESDTLPAIRDWARRKAEASVPA